jgi:hypothetical protein
MTSKYREIREPLINRAKAITATLRESNGREADEVRRIVREFENRVRPAGSSVENPVTVSVGQVIGQSAAAAVAGLEGLTTSMEGDEVWSKTDADRRLLEQQAASEEARAFPVSEWPKYLAVIGTTLFGIGSGAISAEQIEHALPAFTVDGIGPAAAFLVPYSVGAYLLFIAIRAMALSDDRKLATYHSLFGGKKYPDP